MKKGSWMPRYKCADCGHDWAQGGKMRHCPHCGLQGPHDCCRLGWDGIVSTFHLTPTASAAPEPVACCDLPLRVRAAGVAANGGGRDKGELG